MRLRRSILWVPGNSRDQIHPALAGEADCIALDLEDLVPFPQKLAARQAACAMLRELDFRGKEKIVRINPIDTDLGRDDVKAVVPCRPDALRLPKCERTDYVLELDRRIGAAEEASGLEPGSVKIILIVETALGIRNAYDLASCTRRIAAIGLGAEDLTTDLRTERTTTGLELELLYARQKLVIDGRAAGVDVIDTSCLDIENLEDLRNETRMVKQLGFDGKSVIHPRQIPVIHEVFTPAAREVERARKILEAYEKARQEGSFYVFLDGKLVDVPVVKKAERVLAQARAMGAA